MKRVLRRTLLTAAALILYVLFVPLRTGTEFMVDGAWALEPEQLGVVSANESDAGPAERALVPYLVGTYFGYADRSGAVQYQGMVPQRITMDAERYVLFGDRSESSVIQSSTGAFLYLIDTPGYPHLVPDGTVVVGADGLSLTAYDDDGRRLWDHTFASTVTALSASKDLTVIGLAGGGVRAIERSGAFLDIDAASVGLAGVTQAVAVRGDGRAFAAVTGAEVVVTDEQARSVYVTLYEVEDGSAVPVLRREFRRDPRRVPVIALSDDGSHLVFTEQGLDSGASRVVDLLTGDDLVVDARFPPVDLALSPGSEFLFVLERAERPDPSRGFRYPGAITYASTGGHTVISAELAADSIAMQHHGQLVTVTIDDRILAFRVERR